MRALLLSAAALALAATTTFAGAQVYPPQPDIVMAPGDAVEVDGQHCLMTSPFDKVVWCSGIGKISTPACAGRPGIYWIPGTNRKEFVCQQAGTPIHLR